MRILLVAATEKEIAPLLEKKPEADVLITGIGAVATAYRLAKTLGDKQRSPGDPYDLVVNAGIAGSFSRDLSLGTVVQVVNDRFADLGAEDGETFLDLFQLGLADPGEAPFRDGKLCNSRQVGGLPEAEGITVNTAHGEETHIHRTASRFVRTVERPVVESMEGAAFFYVCMSEGISCLQVRAVSNYVERRNRGSWNIPLAVENLNEALSRILPELKGRPPGTGSGSGLAEKMNKQ